MDLATIIGIVSAFALVVIAMSLGGSVGQFIDVKSLLIVVGGTIGVTLINYPLRDLLKLIGIVKQVFFSRVVPVPQLISQFVEYATKARREGILALEAIMKEVNDPFLRKGLQLTVDGLEPAAIKEILETEIDYVADRHRLGAEIFLTMGTFAPALGMIGTLIGLVQMLAAMDDPSSIGPAMAVAIITTFYGAVMANMVFLPMSGKLRNRSQEEVMVKELILNGVLSIARGDNPRVIEQKLHSFLPPALRQSVFK
ncbi:motility protein A [Dethiosulfatarculus sandiegensis]|uniref:Flagellar motor protein MotP n=1 Tax=Dethiosulfatarculus sandiegensis TaxID=1429043 RepID=A0A0D2HSM9_9BACT|nr:MotA/TolQ/ExbB proton channel family protein [Dethiosulfatarculus sandiegensis]KIX13508.1 flagellar motor protein MotP [Dethiosulfatarculus sandiegensis]